MGTVVKDKLGVDASKLFEALKYQIHVAINYCHTLDKSDVMWIEVFGDVTVEGRVQVEVKDYKDSLSDSHTNFWNTLNNWLKPEFQHRQYASLILLTTQAYGERASLKDWEQSDIGQRLDILEAIYKAGEARFESSIQDATDSIADEPSDVEYNGRTIHDQDTVPEPTDDNVKRSPPKPSDSLRLQRQVMAPAIRNSLQAALPKIKIITEQPHLPTLISNYKICHLKPIMEHRKDEFLDDLFGFMTNAGKITGGWKITGAEFDKKFAELTVRYVNGTVKFPRIDSDELGLKAEKLDVRNRSFAKKIDEIGGDEELIRQATVELLHASKYIGELIKDVTTSQADIEQYSSNELKMHQFKRKSAMYKCVSMFAAADLKSESCAFYFDRCGESVTSFNAYDFTPLEFRNGLYHMLADQDSSKPQDEFHWRLWK